MKKIIVFFKALFSTIAKIPSLISKQFKEFVVYYNTPKVTAKSIEWYGWKSDQPDQRDFKYSSISRELQALPSSADLRYNCPPVVSQSTLGSCTGNALAGVLGYLEEKDSNKTQPFNPLSRLFIYYNERAIEGTVNSDSGAAIRDGIKTLKSQGACSEAIWPYKISSFKKKPSTKAYLDGKNHVIQTYARLSTLSDMKNCLASGFPFVFGFTVYESFESDEVAKTGIVPMPAATEKILGGHAVVCVGFDDSTQRFLVRNSWGIDWGQNGYFTMPYEYLTNPNLASDFWMITKAKNL